MVKDVERLFKLVVKAFNCEKFTASKLLVPFANPVIFWLFKLKFPVASYKSFNGVLYKTYFESANWRLSPSVPSVGSPKFLIWKLFNSKFALGKFVL